MVALVGSKPASSFDDASSDGAPSSAGGSSLEREIAGLLVEVLRLEVTADGIDPEAPLFGEGLGLDSIDALEIALMISQRYAVSIRSDDPRNQEIFASLRNLAAYVGANRPQPG